MRPFSYRRKRLENIHQAKIPRPNPLVLPVTPRVNGRKNDQKNSSTDDIDSLFESTTSASVKSFDHIPPPSDPVLVVNSKRNSEIRIKSHREKIENIFKISDNHYNDDSDDNDGSIW
jgi:hypothetical protein